MVKRKAAGNKKSSTDSSATPSFLFLSEDDVQCPICLNLLVEPVRMPCNHCLCRTCFNANLKQSTLQCPVCRARIGTFARRSMKADTLVDQELWLAIQRQFKKKLQLQKMEIADRMAPIGNNQGLSPVVGPPAAPGEIRKEFEEQMQQLQQTHQQPELERQLAADEQMATHLHAELNSPAGLTRRHSMAAAAEESDSSPADSESEEEEDSSESNKSSARRLFKGRGSSVASRKRKAPHSKSSATEENTAPQQRSKTRKKPLQFPGCVKRPRLAGTTALNITVEEHTDDEKEISLKSDSSNEKFPSHKSSTSTTVNSSKTKGTLKNNRKGGKMFEHANTKSGVATEKNQNKQCPTSRADNVKCAVQKRPRTPSIGKKAKRPSVSSPDNSNEEPSFAGPSTPYDVCLPRDGASSSRASLSSGSSRTSSGYGSISSTATISPNQRGRRQLGLDELQDVALALMQDGPHDLESTAAMVAEQRTLERALRQEAQDMKLAQRLQRQFSKLKVDRTQGSGEEYGLRSRDQPVRRARGRADRELSPCY